MKLSEALAVLLMFWLGVRDSMSRSVGMGEVDDEIQVPQTRMRRFAAQPAYWTLTGSGCKPLVDKLTNTLQQFYNPIKDLYNIPINADRRIKLCDKELFQEPSCTPGLGCLKDLGGRVTNYRFYLLGLRSSGKGSKLNKSLLSSSINALQDVLVYLQRDCKARSAGGTSCVWPDPAPSCLPSGQNLAFDNSDVADETAVTLSRGLLEVVRRTKYT